MLAEEVILDLIFVKKKGVEMLQDVLRSRSMTGGERPGTSPVWDVTLYRIITCDVMYHQLP